MRVNLRDAALDAQVAVSSGTAFFATSTFRFTVVGDAFGLVADEAVPQVRKVQALWEVIEGGVQVDLTMMIQPTRRNDRLWVHKVTVAMTRSTVRLVNRHDHSPVSWRQVIDVAKLAAAGRRLLTERPVAEAKLRATIFGP